MNSSYNVGEPQLRRIRDEFWYASKLMDKVYSGKEKWNALFESNGFFDQHQNYLQVRNVASFSISFPSVLELDLSTSVSR